MIVAGTILKRDGKLVCGDLRRARDRAGSSFEHLLQHTTVQPHWIQSARQPAPHSHGGTNEQRQTASTFEGT